MAETSLVLELQQLASNGQTSVTDLLRKALIVASKLKILDFQGWIDSELSGYADKEVPKYRQMMGEVRMFNPYRGWIPLFFPDEEIARRFSAVQVANPIEEIEGMAKHDGENGIVMNFTANEERYLMEASDSRFKPVRFLAPTQLVGIVSVVRSTILRWALDLEQGGILGTGMTFSNEEKQKAAQNSNVHFHGDFKGVFGSVTGHNVQIGDYASIHEQLKEAGVSQEERNELENILDEIKTAKPEEKPSLMQRGIDWVGRNEKFLGALSTIIKGWFS
jgi:hypothetical protein